MFEHDSLRCRSSFSALPLPTINSRLYLYIFRGEPAISEFDWHFTSIHNSSKSFDTLPGADLLTPFKADSSWSWIDHPVSGLVPATAVSRYRSTLINGWLIKLIANLRMIRIISLFAISLHSLSILVVSNNSETRIFGRLGLAFTAPTPKWVKLATDS